MLTTIDIYADHREHSSVFKRHSSFEVQTIKPDVDNELLSQSALPH